MCPACAGPESAALAGDDLDLLARMRRLPPQQVGGTPSVEVTGWLDRLCRDEAERPLLALTYLRRGIE